MVVSPPKPRGSRRASFDSIESSEKASLPSIATARITRPSGSKAGPRCCDPAHAASPPRHAATLATRASGERAAEGTIDEIVAKAIRLDQQTAWSIQDGEERI